MEKRFASYPHSIGVRLDDRTLTALKVSAKERGLKPTELARELIAGGLVVIDAVAPIRRRASPVRDEETIRVALHLLGEIGGNLQRIYSTLAAGGQADDDLLDVKLDLRAIADQFRDSLRAGPPA